MTDCDILVAGGGLSGLTAAAVLAGRGFAVLCCDPAAGNGRDDNRTTAFLGPSVDVLESAGIWDRIADHAAPLSVMTVAEAGSDPPRTCRAHDFAAEAIGEERFGFAIPNVRLAEALRQRLAELPGAELRSGAAVAAMLPRTREIVIRLDDGARIRARLLIAADGRNSRLRRQAGIGMRRFRFGQKALTLDVALARPHANVTAEIHHVGGPFTLVPQAGAGQDSTCSVVWMDRGPEIDRLAKLGEREFERELNARSFGLCGALTPLGERHVWPISSGLAERFAAERMVLAGEAAHVVPPIGAQGLNMTMADISALARLEAGADPGAARHLERYDRARRPAVRRRMAAISLLDLLSMAAPRAIRSLRAEGLSRLAATPWMRDRAMRWGMRPGAA